MSGTQLNFDGLVGPTHNYAGLSFGNLASAKHEHAVSSPKEAALEGLAKMKRLADLGVAQAVLPPHERPDVAMLRGLGFYGSDQKILENAYQSDPKLLAAACSASAMWAANSVTVSPSADTADGRIHFTVANLVSELHRSIEASMTGDIFRRIFLDPDKFAHHPPLPATATLRDEGAANHMRLCSDYDQPGVELFVYGCDESDRQAARPTRYPARQTREACRAIVRRHQLDPSRTVMLQQHPNAIDSGVFHNDVIAVVDRDLLFYHECAWLESAQAVESLQRAYESTCGGKLRTICVKEADLSLRNVVSSYLFNSQIVRSGDGRTILIAPQDCANHAIVRPYLDSLNVFDEVIFIDLRQSMRNGGGPACLRLSVALRDNELPGVRQSVMLDDRLYETLVAWVQQFYRDQLHPAQLCDPKLIDETRTALDALTQILGLGSIYSFQQ